MVALLAVMKELYWVGDLVDEKESELAVLKDSVQVALKGRNEGIWLDVKAVVEMVGLKGVVPVGRKVEWKGYVKVAM